MRQRGEANGVRRRINGNNCLWNVNINIMESKE